MWAGHQRAGPFDQRLAGEPFPGAPQRLRALGEDPEFAALRTADFPYVLGVTNMATEAGLNMNMTGSPRSDGSYCWSVTTLDIVFRSINTVHIGSEIPRGSCLWNVVSKHEQAHVDVNEVFFRRLPEMTRPDVLNVARRTLAASNGEEAKAFFGAATRGQNSLYRQRN